MADIRKRKPFYVGEWYPWYPDVVMDSERVQKLSLAEEGAYRRALDKQWKKGSLPADPKAFADQIGKGCTVRMAQKLLHFFVKKRGSKTRVVNLTLEAVRSEQQEIALRHSERGKKGAAKRWGKKDLDDSLSNGTTNAQAMAIPSREEEKRVEEIRIDKKRIDEKRVEETASNANAFSAENLASLDDDPLTAFASLTTQILQSEKNSFLKTLAQDPAYMHCNVRDEFDKASAWADKHKKPITKEFFINWLNRIFKPIEDKEEIDAREYIEQARARVAQRDAALHRPGDADS